MVAPTTSTTRRVTIDVTDDQPGRIVEESPGTGLFRWHCGICPGHSIGVYDGQDAAADGLRRHHEAIRPEVHR